MMVGGDGRWWKDAMRVILRKGEKGGFWGKAVRTIDYGEVEKDGKLFERHAV